MYLNPYESWRYELKKGMVGTDVAALQINIPDLVVDGWFGKQTERKIKAFQARFDLLADGVAGGATQRKLVEVRSQKADNGMPVGLLKSICANESGFFLGASSKHPSDSGIDVGAYMLSSGSGPGSQDFYYHAYHIASAALDAAADIKGQYNSVPAHIVSSSYLIDLANSNKEIFRWQLAVLSHNWPYAAYNIPRRGHIFLNPNEDDEPAQWIIQASGGRLETPRGWVYSYIQKSTIYINW